MSTICLHRVAIPGFNYSVFKKNYPDLCSSREIWLALAGENNNLLLILLRNLRPFPEWWNTPSAANGVLWLVSILHTCAHLYLPHIYGLGVGHRWYSTLHTTHTVAHLYCTVPATHLWPWCRPQVAVWTKWKLFEWTWWAGLSPPELPELEQPAKEICT